MVHPSTRTGPKVIKDQERLNRVLALRTQGWMLREIAVLEGVSDVRIHQLIRIALHQLVAEPGEELRQLEQARLDDLQTAVWERAINGELAAIDRVLSIMERRSRLLGLDAPRPTTLVGIGVASDGYDPPPTIKVEVVSQAPFPRRSAE